MSVYRREAAAAVLAFEQTRQQRRGFQEIRAAPVFRDALGDRRQDVPGDPVASSWSARKRARSRPARSRYDPASCRQAISTADSNARRASSGRSRLRSMCPASLFDSASAKASPWLSRFRSRSVWPFPRDQDRRRKARPRRDRITRSGLQRGSGLLPVSDALLQLGDPPRIPVDTGLRGAVKDFVCCDQKMKPCSEQNSTLADQSGAGPVFATEHQRHADGGRAKATIRGKFEVFASDSTSAVARPVAA